MCLQCALTTYFKDSTIGTNDIVNQQFGGALQYNNL